MSTTHTNPNELRAALSTLCQSHGLCLVELHTHRTRFAGFTTYAVIPQGLPVRRDYRAIGRIPGALLTRFFGSNRRGQTARCVHFGHLQSLYNEMASLSASEIAARFSTASYSVSASRLETELAQ